MVQFIINGSVHSRWLNSVQSVEMNLVQLKWVQFSSDDFSSVQMAQFGRIQFNSVQKKKVLFSSDKSSLDGWENLTKLYRVWWFRIQEVSLGASPEIGRTKSALGVGQGMEPAIARAVVPLDVVVVGARTACSNQCTACAPGGAPSKE